MRPGIEAQATALLLKRAGKRGRALHTADTAGTGESAPNKSPRLMEPEAAAAANGAAASGGAASRPVAARRSKHHRPRGAADLVGRLSTSTGVKLTLKLALLGDGHCLFRALAWAVQGNENAWCAVKARIVQHMRTPAYAERNYARIACLESVVAWQTMVTNLAARGDSSDFWPGEFEIAAAEEVFDVFIHVLQASRSNDPRTRIRGDESPPSGMQSRPTIRLLYSQIKRPSGTVGH